MCDNMVYLHWLCSAVSVSPIDHCGRTLVASTTLLQSSDRYASIALFSLSISTTMPYFKQVMLTVILSRLEPLSESIITENVGFR